MSEVLGLLFILAVIASLFPWPTRALCSAREGTAIHLIEQLDQAVESYQIDCGAYPPGDGSGTSALVSGLSRSGPRKQKYFEFPPDLLRGGDVINPVRYDTAILHYLCPGVHRPEKFDLWAEDCRGNPTGINTWDRMH